MKKIILISFMLALTLHSSGQHKETISLNGSWQFEQTQKDRIPQQFTRTIPVPGLIHLARPKIEAYDTFLQRPEETKFKLRHTLYDIDYTTKYS